MILSCPLTFIYLLESLSKTPFGLVLAGLLPVSIQLLKEKLIGYNSLVYSWGPLSKMLDQTIWYRWFYNRVSECQDPSPCDIYLITFNHPLFFLFPPTDPYHSYTLFSYIFTYSIIWTFLFFFRNKRISFFFFSTYLYVSTHLSATNNDSRQLQKHTVII